MPRIGLQMQNKLTTDELGLTAEVGLVCRRERTALETKGAWQTEKDLDLSPGANSGGWFHTCDLGLKKPKVGGS